jgi:hypothetical protein
MNSKIKNVSSAMQKKCKKFSYAGASTACRLVAFSATFGYCLLRILRLSVIHFITHYHEKCTDMVLCLWYVLCYGSADGVALRAQALYRECFRCVVFRIRKHFWVLSTGKWYFSAEKCTPRVLDLESQILDTVEENPSTSIW